MIPLINTADRQKLKERALDLIEKGYVEGLIILIENLKENDFASKNASYFLLHAAQLGHFEIIKYLISQRVDVGYAPEYALRTSVIKGHLSIIKYLIQNGADVKSLDDGALFCAKYNGHTEVVEYLEEVLKHDSTHQ